MSRPRSSPRPHHAVPRLCLLLPPQVLTPEASLVPESTVSSAQDGGPQHAAAPWNSCVRDPSWPWWLQTEAFPVVTIHIQRAMGSLEMSSCLASPLPVLAPRCPSPNALSQLPAPAPALPPYLSERTVKCPPLSLLKLCAWCWGPVNLATPQKHALITPPHTSQQGDSKARQQQTSYPLGPGDVVGV